MCWMYLVGHTLNPRYPMRPLLCGLAFLLQFSVRHLSVQGVPRVLQGSGDCNGREEMYLRLEDNI